MKKYNLFPNFLTTKVFLFGFALFGYGIISLLINNYSQSRYVTVPYRFIILFLSLLVIIFSYSKNLKNTTNTNIFFVVNNQYLFNFTRFLLTSFLFFYSLRLLDYTSSNSLNTNFVHGLSKPSEEYLLNWFGMCLIPGISFSFINRNESKKYLYFSWIVVFLASIFLMFNLTQNPSLGMHGRLSREGFNPISISQYGVSLVMLSISILSMSRDKSVTKHKHIFYPLCFCSLILGSFVAFLGASRGPIIALIICFLLNLLIAKYEVKSFISKPILICFACVVFVVTSLAAIQTGSVYIKTFLGFLSMFGGIGKDADTSSIERLELLKKVIPLIKENFLFGYNIEIPGMNYVHNLIIDAFFSTGFLGGLTFAFLYIYGINKSLFLLKTNWLNWGWLGILYIQYAIGGMFSGGLYNSTSFWYLLFAILNLRVQKVNPILQVSHIMINKQS